MADLAENRTSRAAAKVLVSADTRKKALFCKQGKVLNSLWLKNPRNLRNPWLIKVLCAYKSLYNCKDTFTDVMSALQIKLFMQNKAKFQKVKLNVTNLLTKYYDEMDTWSIRKKQSQTNPNKAKSKKAKMNVSQVLTKDYENKPPIWAPKKQSQTSKRQKPIQTSLSKGIRKKTRFWVPKKQTQTNPIQCYLKSHFPRTGFCDTMNQ